MAQTKFSGPVVSTNGFEGEVDTLGTAIVTATPSNAANAANLSATRYITIVGQNGTTYYVPVSTTAW